MVNQAFREHVTRVSFSLTLTRNQLATLRSVVLDYEDWKHRGSAYEPGFGAGSEERRLQRKHSREEFGITIPDAFIVGIRFLIHAGLAERTPEIVADEARLDQLKAEGKYAVRKYYGPANRPTEAGWHLVALLRIAGLIPEALANENRKRRSKAA